MSELNTVNQESIIEFLESIGFEKQSGIPSSWIYEGYALYFLNHRVHILSYEDAVSIGSISRIDLRLGEAKVKAVIKAIIGD